MTMMKAEDINFRGLELEAIGKKVGMHEGGLDDFLALRSTEFSIEHDKDGVRVLMHTATGLPAEQFCNINARAQWSHLFPAPYSVETAELAFGAHPSLTAQGQLVKEVGRFEAEQHAKKWGTKLGSLTPGRNPDDTVVDTPKPRSKNPWSAENFDLARQRQIVTTLGVQKAQQLAAAAGSFVGATSPKSKRLIPR